LITDPSYLLRRGRASQEEAGPRATRRGDHDPPLAFGEGRVPITVNARRSVKKVSASS
jgi:hypothetical protein